MGFVGLKADDLKSLRGEGFGLGDDFGAAVEHQQENNGIGLIIGDFIILLQGELNDFLVDITMDNAAEQGFGI